MTIDEAVKNLENALDEPWPTDFMDPTAVRTVLGELRRLQQLEQRP